MTKKELMSGNEAMAEAAVRAGCDFFASYPITPQTSILEYLSTRMFEVGGEFVQAESEIAAINMVMGASAAGGRVMTATAGMAVSRRCDQSPAFRRGLWRYQILADGFPLRDQVHGTRRTARLRSVPCLGAGGRRYGV